MLVTPRTAAAAPTPVLVIDSYGGRWEPARKLTSALRRDLPARAGMALEFVEVPLRARSEDDHRLEPSLVTYLHALFDEREPALVIALGRAAGLFVARQRQQLFPNAPTLTLFCIEPDLADLHLGPTDAAVTYAYDLPWAIETLLAAAPGTERLFVVLGHTAAELRLRAGYGPFLAQVFPKLAITWSTDLSFDELERTVGTLPPRTLVIYVSFDRDRTEARVEDAIALPAVLARSSAPVAGIYEEMLGTGVVGTVHADLEATRHEAVTAAAAILRGEEPSAARVTPKARMGATFDARALARWGIGHDRLPPFARVVNAPATFWSAYGRWVLGGGLVIALQGATILILTHSRRRLRAERATLAALRRRLLTAQEDEQRRLARELHDDIAQRLGRLSFDAARLAAPGEPVERIAGEMRATIASLATDVSAMSYRLHPASLEDLGLEEAMRRECDALRTRASLDVQFAGHAPTDRLDREAELGLFRVLQESLRNVARHAKASHVLVTLATIGDRVQLAVRDDGVGLDTHAQDPGRPHLGLASMRERVELLGGEIAVESEPSGGTSVVAWVPLAKPPTS